jgi:tetratricopeptide (TPR) repeat protein
MSRVRLLAAAVAVLGVLSAPGCHSCPAHEKAEAQFGLAEFNYQNQQFDQAKRIYMNALENCPELDAAMLGLGNACREYGTDLYRLAQDHFDQNKREAAEKTFQEANQNHGQAERCFRTLLEKDPEDLKPQYGLALLWYQRAASPWSVPYPPGDRRRAEERGRAIDLFSKLVKSAPDLFQAHRYLGLLYFEAGQMDEGRRELKIYHDYQQRWHNVVMGWPQQTPQQKTSKESALRQIEREIEQCREVLLGFYEAVKKERARLEKKPSRTLEEEKSLGVYAQEMLRLEAIVKAFVVTRIGPAELEVWQRCQLYFSSVNRGILQDALGFAFVKQGEDSLVRQKVAERLERGVRYERLSHRSIQIEGDTSTVALVCDRIARKGASPESIELTLRFKLQGGQWMVADHDHP